MQYILYIIRCNRHFLKIILHVFRSHHNIILTHFVCFHKSGLYI
nr:MAG TPA: hypothetical protein [Caudoviricetes sp.]